MEKTATGPIVWLVPALTTEQQTADGAVAIMAPVLKQMFRASGEGVDRKSTRLNSSHQIISYAVFCLKKKKKLKKKI